MLSLFIPRILNKTKGKHSIIVNDICICKDNENNLRTLNIKKIQTKFTTIVE